MKTKKEFEQYIADTIKDYLPDSYRDATIKFHEVVKNTDVHLTGITIQRPGEEVYPRLFLDHFWDEYQKGKDIDEIVDEIADMRTENEVLNFSHVVDRTISDYENVKENLQIHLHDTEKNQELLSNLVHTEHSDFSATYLVVMAEGEMSFTAAVTTEMLKDWNVSMEQLHSDAMNDEMKRKPFLADLTSVVMGGELGLKPKNLLDSPEEKATQVEFQMYYFSTEERVYGASLILQDELRQKIGNILEDNYYVLPSSVHDVLIVPENADYELFELSAMVADVNENGIHLYEFLSDHVQYYDRSTHVLENAEKRAIRLEAEKEKEKTPVQKKSIKERLKEKKKSKGARKSSKDLEQTDKKKEAAL